MNVLSDSGEWLRYSIHSLSVPLGVLYSPLVVWAFYLCRHDSVWLSLLVSMIDLLTISKIDSFISFLKIKNNPLRLLLF